MPVGPNTMPPPIAVPIQTATARRHAGVTTARVHTVSQPVTPWS
jgi:hypothetical protein